jgi:hypothetical protein
MNEPLAQGFDNSGNVDTAARVNTYGKESAQGTKRAFNVDEKSQDATTERE